MGAGEPRRLFDDSLSQRIGLHDPHVAAVAQNQWHEPIEPVDVHLDDPMVVSLCDLVLGLPAEVLELEHRGCVDPQNNASRSDPKTIEILAPKLGKIEFPVSLKGFARRRLRVDNALDSTSPECVLAGAVGNQVPEAAFPDETVRMYNVGEDRRAFALGERDCERLVVEYRLLEDLQILLRLVAPVPLARVDMDSLPNALEQFAIFRGNEFLRSPKNVLNSFVLRAEPEETPAGQQTGERRIIAEEQRIELRAAPEGVAAARAGGRGNREASALQLPDIAVDCSQIHLEPRCESFRSLGSTTAKKKDDGQKSVYRIASHSMLTL